MDLETRNILGYDYLPYMIVVSLEMSDEPFCYGVFADDANGSGCLLWFVCASA